MMYWNEAAYIEKIQSWRDLRNDIKDLDVSSAVDVVAKYWAKVPYANSIIDIFEPSEWPTPWMILDSNRICCNMISLMIYHTFKYSRPELRTELKVVFEKDCNFLVVNVENFILNYHLGFPMNEHEQDLMFVHTYIDI